MYLILIKKIYTGNSQIMNKLKQSNLCNSSFIYPLSLSLSEILPHKYTKNKLKTGIPKIVLNHRDKK